MPAGSEPPALPHTFRPLGVRIAIYGFGTLLLVVAAVVWFAMPQEVRDAFTVFERITLVLIALAGVAAGYALARSRIVARQEQVLVVNGYRTRRLDWNQIVAVNLAPGSPWAVLDLADGTSVSAMGIQGSDGARASRQARQLRALVDRLTRTDNDN